MIENILIRDDELKKFAQVQDLSDQCTGLLHQQKQNWMVLKDGYESLESVAVRNIEFENFIIKVQFNPKRIISSSAKVDSDSIKNRKCFLCTENLPENQRGILFQREYIILCNPYPIFKEHFTIPNINHLPQQIEFSFPTMLDLAKDISKKYIVFYNGPKCGASAPDHIHFQSGERYFMPLDKEYDLVSEVISEDSNFIIRVSANYLRYFISFESNDKKKLNSAFKVFYQKLQKLTNVADEPMMNIIVSYYNNSWKVILFPRGVHRPKQYFDPEEKRILLSPAAVDMGGVLITPLEKDFNKITKDDIVNIFRQVSIPKEFFEYIKKSVLSKNFIF